MHRLARSASYRWRLASTLVRHWGRRPPICDDVGAWASAHQGAAPRSLYGPSDYRRRPPRTIEPEILDEFTRRLTGTRQGRYLVPVRDARLVGREGIVVLPDGSYSQESILGRRNLLQRTEYTAPPRRAVVRRPGDYFVLLDFISRGHYYHWLHDTLSRVYGVREHLPPGVVFVVSPALTRLQRDSLRVVGIREEHLVEFSGDDVWELERLHFASPTVNSGHNRLEVDHWLRDAVFDAYGIEPQPARRRIFISRNSVPHRQLVNEREVLDFLHPYGFERCVPEALDLEGQATLVAGAEMLVSTHGSALTNMLFAPPGLRVVDMIPPSMFPNAFAFWNMAEELGHEYWYFTAEGVETAGKRQPDTRVSVEKLAATFERMGVRRP